MTKPVVITFNIGPKVVHGGSVLVPPLPEGTEVYIHVNVADVLPVISIHGAGIDGFTVCDWSITSDRLVVFDNLETP